MAERLGRVLRVRMGAVAGVVVVGVVVDVDRVRLSRLPLRASLLLAKQSSFRLKLRRSRLRILRVNY